MTAVTGLAALPAVLFYACLRVVEGTRRNTAEADIREVELSIKREELTQQQIKSRLLEAISKNVEQSLYRSKIDIPKEVLIEVAKTTVSPVAELTKNPLIGSVTVGISNIPKTH